MTSDTLPAEIDPWRDRDLRQRELVPKDKLGASIITVIGVGAIGRQVALQLAAIGALHIQLVDHDSVEIVNLAPQGYFPRDVGKLKVHATGDLIHQINPSVELELIPERFRSSRNDWGEVVFVCVDSIDTRKRIWDAVQGSDGLLLRWKDERSNATRADGDKCLQSKLLPHNTFLGSGSIPRSMYLQVHSLLCNDRRRLHAQQFYPMAPRDPP